MYNTIIEFIDIWAVRTDAAEELIDQSNNIGGAITQRLRLLGHIDTMGRDRNVRRDHLRRSTGLRRIGYLRYRCSNARKRTCVIFKQITAPTGLLNRLR